jgi:acetyl-CoA acetyltransferase family protein
MPSAFVPYGAYWSTPFVKWQGSLSHLHPLRFAAWVAQGEIGRRGWAPEGFDAGVLGTTVPSGASFYGLPWVASLAGLPHLAGPTVAQACATAARALQVAHDEVALGRAQAAIVLTADRISNGPHLYYPDPGGPGGTGEHEDWVLDNFSRDPATAKGMLATAENVAREYGLSRERQHELVLMRHAQYATALADDRAFQRRFMRLPFDVPDRTLRRTAARIDGDEGIPTASAERLAAMGPVQPDGTVSFAAQTRPADGNAAIVVASRERARALSADPRIEVALLGFGQARAAAAEMPKAPVPAARRALQAAGLEVAAIDCVTTHNPFAVNDLVFARETGVPLERMNARGCSLVWGHPQGPTGARAVIELIETLVERGGGRGLFTGCAAGDTAMACVLEVRDAGR